MQTRRPHRHASWRTVRRWDCSVSWTAPLSRSFARPKKKRTANRYCRGENKTKGWKQTLVKPKPQPPTGVRSGGYELLSAAIISHVTYSSPHTMSYYATCTFNRLRTPIRQSKPHSAHLLITTGVYTLLTCLSYFLLFIPSVVMCCTSSSCSAPNATLPNPH